MKEKLVKQIKEFTSTEVAHAMYLVGYTWRNPNRVPHNIDIMLMGVPRHLLVDILRYCHENA